MASLNWKQVGGSGSGAGAWEAEYDAYQTPAGPARATAKVYPGMSMYRYETWVEDPWVAGVSRTCYVRMAYGSERTAEEARGVCEDYGFRKATAGPGGDQDIRFKLYDNANVAKLAARHLEECGYEDARLVGWMSGGTMRFEAYEGGYEQRQLDVRLDTDSMSFDVWHT